MIFFFLLLKWLMSMLNSPSAMMIVFLILALISPAEAVITCTSTSNQCCWVRRFWESMKGVTFSNTGATACCYYLGSTTQTSGIPGVNCTTMGTVTTVTQLLWDNKGLTGTIPPEIGNFVNLTLL
jgi:hypothetical protein